MAKVAIYKYPLSVNAHPQCVEMQDGATILKVAGQHDQVCLWAKVDPKALKCTRTFLVLGTGWDFDDVDTHYVGTAIVVGGKFVWHVYEVVP